MDLHRAKSILWQKISLPKEKAQQEEKADFLRTIPLFSELTRRQLTDLGRIIYERHYRPNEFLFEVNHPGAALFIIREGRVSIEAPSQTDDPTQLAVLAAGTFLGELALLDQSPRSASARALEATITYALFREDLNKLIETAPQIASHIYRALAVIISTRLKATNSLFQRSNESEAA